MFDPIPDYAPDLEWMVQSGQVPRELLLEALVFEFYAPVFCLSLAILDDHRFARRATNNAFSKALLSLHDYRSQEGVEIWLYRIVLDSCRVIQGKLQTFRTLKAYLPFLSKTNDFGDSIPETFTDSEIWLAVDHLDSGSRQIILLHCISGWTAERIAVLLGEPLNQVEASLVGAQAVPLKRMEDGLDSSIKTSQPASEALLSTIKSSLQRRWPPGEITKHELERVIGQIGRRASSLGTRRRGFISLVEIAVIALIILLGTGVAWGMNLIGEQQSVATPTKPVNTVLVTEIVYQYITATPEPPVLNFATSSTPSRLRKDQFVTVGDAESLEALANRIGESPEELKNLNRIPSGVGLSTGQRLLAPEGWDSLIPHPITQFSPVEPALPLSEPYFSEMILQRLAVQGPRFSTLWFDAQIIDYGPRSYIGPADVFRGQFWEGEGQSLSLIGYPDRLPEEALLHVGRNSYLARPSNETPWFSEWQNILEYNSPSRDMMSRMVQSLFDTRELERGYSFKVIGRDEIAKINSIVFDVLDRDDHLTDRIWYDDSRGFILRRITFLPGNDEQALFEVRINRVSYDIDFPPDLFDSRLPWRGSYASDSRGTPEDFHSAPLIIANDRTPRPVELTQEPNDLGKSVLSFQYPPNFLSDTAVTRVWIFSDGYLLGSTLFGNPWRTICARSPDGERIAFVSQVGDATDGSSILNWFKLSSPEDTYQPLSARSGVTSFAFSPDGRQIAYFSRSESHGMGELSIVDTVTLKSRPLLKIGDLNSLVWDPQGTSLAMIARYEPGSYSEFVTVFDIESGKISYNAPIDYQSNAVREDWPMLDWGVEFPVEMGGMDDCAMPPQP
jgi:DNA-directed RNA polymerase specialized sigma24 family protein